MFADFFALYFPAFGLTMEIYKVNIGIQSKCGKIRTTKTPNTDTFRAVKPIIFTAFFARQE